MKKIEKLPSLAYHVDDVVLNNRETLNLVIDAVNELQGEEKPEEAKGVCKYCGSDDVVIGGKGTTHYYYCNGCERPTDLVDKQEEKPEDWKEELIFTYGHIYFRNEDGEFCLIKDEIYDLIDFIEQELSKAREEGYQQGVENLYKYGHKKWKAVAKPPVREMGNTKPYKD